MSVNGELSMVNRESPMNNISLLKYHKSDRHFLLYIAFELAIVT